jgi:hypothetical protein
MHQARTDDGTDKRVDKQRIEQSGIFALAFENTLGDFEREKERTDEKQSVPTQL